MSPALFRGSFGPCQSHLQHCSTCRYPSARLRPGLTAQGCRQQRELVQSQLRAFAPAVYFDQPQQSRPLHRRLRRSSRCSAGVDDKVLYSSDVPISKLQQQLEQAIEDEDYDTAATLRDIIQRRRFDARLAVEEANERFYQAFRSGSLSAMADVWGSGEAVQCIHPLAGCIAGRQAVMESWRAILGSARMKIDIEDVRICASDNHAFVTCLELTESGESRGCIAATNVFERQGGKWKLVHHHGSPVPPGAR